MVRAKGISNCRPRAERAAWPPKEREQEEAFYNSEPAVVEDDAPRPKRPPELPPRSASRSWPYPNTFAQTARVLIAFVILSVIGLIIVAVRFNAYQNRMLDKGDIQEAAATLESYTLANNQMIALVKEGKISNSFRQAYTSQLDQQVVEIIRFLRKHRAPQSYQYDVQQLISAAYDMRAVLRTIFRPSGSSALTRVRSTNQDIGRRIHAVERRL